MTYEPIDATTNAPLTPAWTGNNYHSNGRLFVPEADKLIEATYTFKIRVSVVGGPTTDYATPITFTVYCGSTTPTPYIEQSNTYPVAGLTEKQYVLAGSSTNFHMIAQWTVKIATCPIISQAVISYDDTGTETTYQGLDSALV